ncbi:lysosomal alpha-glucosidase-like isoform X1 [Lineus longissimus]|uniref:lysosomal alpha-glucosidase-like isoform X1 n=1 Tax=Lineus longissimus TaxID=88925 RepID=UPI00315DC455
MKEDKHQLVKSGLPTLVFYPVRSKKNSPKDPERARRNCLVFVMVVSGVAFLATIGITALFLYASEICLNDLENKDLVYEGNGPESDRTLLPGMTGSAVGPSCSVATRTDCFPEGGASEDKCKAKGCCWKPTERSNRVDSMVQDTPWCFYPSSTPPDPKCNVPDPTRLDCYPESGASPDKCKAKGCCWVPASSTANGIPYCFYPADNSTGYNMSQPQPTSFGYTTKLTRNKHSHWPDDVMTLQMDLMMETKTRDHFKIYDPQNKRYEVPIDTPKVTSKVSSTDYKVDFQQVPAGLTISRSSTGSKLFDTTKYQLTYADQFIEISSSLPTKYIYGLGEHRGQLWLDGTNTKKVTFWARDVPPQENTNLYGTHPFFIGIEEDGDAYGVFLLNSNAMDIIISGSTITYRTIGGILDFWVFTGPTPDDVISQYTAVIGRPIMPPYWALGFHLCRWGYGGTDGMMRVVNRMRAGNFPYDTQWNDIDYMHNHYDWTYDTVNYPYLDKVVEDLHNHTQHYIMIVDPGIPNIKGYNPYDSGIAKGIFIQAADGSGPIIGVVWPGTTAYPDFSNPASYGYWLDLASGYRKQIPFDGIWIDMNEPSNFVVGSTKGCPANSKYDYPPFVPGVLGGNLRDKTICPSSPQNLSIHYNLHSLYGHFEIVQTNKVLTNLTKKRPFTVSRSTFAGSGKYGFHWLGDNNADWNNIYFSIPGILNFNMFGIPMVGADICGFMGSTTAELCARWMQLGAFYPFMRNHNTKGAPDQDPANPSFPKSAQDAMRDAITLRYTLLPTLYSLLYKSHINGTGVARPLFFQYPKDSKTYTIDKQFLWGDSLMISPVLTQGATTVDAYFPKDVWFDYATGNKMAASGASVTLDAPLDKINVHMRGGSIVVTQGANVTTTLSRKNPFELVAALPNTTNPFNFQWYCDDGDSPMQNGQYMGNLISLTAAKTNQGGYINGVVVQSHFETSMTLGTVRVLGVDTKPNSLTINGKPFTQFSFDAQSHVLMVNSIKIEISNQNFSIIWQ